MADEVKKPSKEWPDYTEELAKCEEFVRDFKDEFGDYKYQDILQQVANRKIVTIDIELDDVLMFKNDQVFVRNIVNNTLRYVKLFELVVDKLKPQPTVEFDDHDVLDVLMEQRLSNVEDEQNSGIPKELLRRFELNIKPLALEKATHLRDVKAQHVGQLVRVKGIVTRVTDVKPVIRVATYTCDVCGHEVYQPVGAESYTPLNECQSADCKDNQTKGKLYPQTRGSKFQKLQRLKLQEMPNEVPVGHIPRSLNVLCTGEHTRKCTPGDVVTMAGIFLVTRFTGFRAVKAGLTADTFLQCMDVVNTKKTYDDSVSPELEARVQREAEDSEIYSKLAKSIAPEIYGMEDVKKALLLLLVGAPTRTMSDKMRIRGDINILLCGDPGVAKSQLLKHISGVAPRGVYTTGKGSSGVGLTAAVNRDEVTGEVTLEGGALVLADNGVCAIDEFDKMEEGDRTAIYEVMEQQTVSIAKAGITTTLNARTSVLAAANPRWGRYNPKVSPEMNIALPTALLSRFDLTFILLDQPSEEADRQLADHIATVHRTNKHPKLDFEPYSSDFLRAYVAKARSYDPFVPKELTNFLVNSYVALRTENQVDEKRQRFCTARSLLSIMRLAQALARLRFSTEVERPDVVEATRLLYVTKSQLEPDSEAKDEDVDSAIFNMIKHMWLQKQGAGYIRYGDLRDAVLSRGMAEQDLKSTIEKYKALDLLSTDKQGKKLYLDS